MSYRSSHPLPTPHAPDCFGVNIHFIDWGLENIDRIADAGFKWVRADFLWHVMEKQKGHIDCTRYDRLLAKCQERGIRVLAILGYGNELYYSDEEKALAATLPPADRLTIAPTDGNPEYKAAWLRFVKNVVRRYRKKGIIWEVWNEPNIHFWTSPNRQDDYAALVEATAKIIRKVHYFEWVAGASTSTFDWDFLSGIFKRGALNHLDMVLPHPYRDRAPETVKSDWLRLRALVEEYKPSWRRIAIGSGEWGYGEYQFAGHLRPTEYQAQMPAASGTKAVGASASEPRRNLLTHTEDFSSPVWRGYWVKPAVSRVLGPDGRLAAWRVEGADKPTQPGMNHSGFLQDAVERPIGKYYMVSCWLRSTSGRQEILIGLDDSYMAGREVGETWERHTALFWLGRETPRRRIFQAYEREPGNAAWEIAYPQVEVVEGVDESVLRASRMEQQGDYLLRMFKANIESGVNLSIWYVWQNSGPDPSLGWTGFGVIDWDGTAKPAEGKIKNVADVLRDWGPHIK